MLKLKGGIHIDGRIQGVWAPAWKEWTVSSPGLCCLIASALLIATSGVMGQSVSSKQAQSSAAAGFRPAVFHGLKIGQAKRDDVLRVIGKPEWEGVGEDGAWWMAYRGIDGIAGLTQFVLDSKSKVLESVTVAVGKMTLEEVTERLGRDSVVTKWSMPVCDGHLGMAPLFLDPKGDISFLEYRQAGISVTLEGFRPIAIDYLSRPIGVDRNPCPPKPRR